MSVAFVGLTRPKIMVTEPSENATIVLAIDSSGSMFAEDVEPTRLGAAQEAARLFLDRLPENFRVGVVTFSTEAQVVAPLTHDRELARQSIEYLFPGAGTAIGDALARSVELAQGESTAEGVPADPIPSAPPAADPEGRPLNTILLLSDGHQTRGMLQPLEGARRAKEAGIPVYTVALGTARGEIVFNRGGFERRIPVPPDPVTLRQIARVTGGEFFEAKTAPKLTEVYESLGSKLGRVRRPREATYLFLGGAAALLLCAGAFSVRWAQHLP
jgi:Ca-activated chloride channel family protein